MDSLELTGRRDPTFVEEVELSAVEEEDDVQEWHNSEEDKARSEQVALDDLANTTADHSEL